MQVPTFSKILKQHSIKKSEIKKRVRSNSSKVSVLRQIPKNIGDEEYIMSESINDTSSFNSYEDEEG